MTGPSDHLPETSGSDELRARRRAFIRASHPDAGGDPEAFIAGLAAFDRPGPRSGPVSEPRAGVYRSRRADRVVARAVRDLRRRIAGKPPRRLQ